MPQVALENDMQTVKTLSILGLGLMGGSLGLGARRSGVAARVHGYARREETRQAALDRGVVDAVFDDACEAVRDADLVVICVPVLMIAPLVEACRDGLSEDAVVTDVGSTKGHLATSINALLKDSGAQFVGSHPIAGSEETGIDATQEDLYKEAVVVVTPSEESAEASVQRVVALWEALDAVVKVCSPQEHDALLACTSHLPHLVAAALVSSVLGGSPERGDYCGSGFRCTTRVAGGSEDVWHDIVKTNREAILNALKGYAREVQNLIEAVEGEDLNALTSFLADARRLRLGWQNDERKGLM